VQGLRDCRKLLRHKSNRKVIKSQYREMKNMYTLYYLHRLNTVVNLGMLGKISSYPTYPIAVILKMAMHLEDPERTALNTRQILVVNLITDALPALSIAMQRP